MWVACAHNFQQSSFLEKQSQLCLSVLDYVVVTRRESLLASPILSEKSQFHFLYIITGAHYNKDTNESISVSAVKAQNPCKGEKTMKKISIRTVSLILCLAMLVGYIVLPEAPAANAETVITNPNLVENGTFETQLGDGTVQANKDGWGYMSGDASVVAEEGNENNYVARIADNKSTGGKYIYYGVDVEPGATYTFKIDYKATYTAASPAIYLRRNAYNGTNLHTKSGLTSDTWETYVTTVEIPADVTKLFIIAASSTAAVGTVYIDNVSVIKGVVADGGEYDEPEQDVTIPKGNLIANSGFETQSEGSIVASTDGWTKLASSKIWSVIADPDKTDNFILKVVDEDTSSGGSINYAITVVPGYYKLKLDYKTNNAPEVHVRGNNASSSGIDLLQTTCPSTNGAWGTFEAIIEIPEEVSTAYVILNSSKAAKNTAYIDNVSFEKTEPGNGNEGGEITEPEYEIVIPEENLLENPLFELTTSLYNTPLNDTAAPTDWTVEITGAGVQLFKTNVKLAYKGDWSILAVDNSVNGSFKMSTKVENIQPGVEYTFAYARMGEGRPVVAVRYYDANGNLLGEYSKNIAGDRTGWEEGELMFYIIGNNSKLGHNQYDQLSFQISTNGLWPAADPGYSNLSDGFDEMQGHNIILVDGQWQTVKGEGTLEQIVDAQLYGQFSGSAPGAYAEGLLTQWDRHAIMINHSDRPYYVVIDEMASETERVFDFNLNTAGWEDVTVDGKTMKDGVNKGNKVAVYGSNGYFFAEFVSKDKFNIEAVTYEDGGPVLQADSGKSKSEQYMTILTKPYGIGVDEYYSFLQLLNTPEQVAYKTSSHDATIIKSVTASSTALFFFRGHNSGDWIELPFMVEESGTFELILRTCKSYNYGIYKVYIDGEYVATYDGYDTRVYVNNFSLGSHEVAAGEHILKLELTGVNPKSIGSLISVASITFAAEREMPENPIYTQEVYDTEKVLGAKIFHTENNSDIVLLNRTAGKITAGGVTTNGEQTAIIGLMEDGYMEGFTLVAGTSLTFDGKTLVKASSAATVSADFRGKAKYAVTTEKDQSISLYAPYEIVGATVDGKSVKYSVDGKVAKISVPAGTHTVELKVIGAVEYLWGNESGSGKAIYDENGEMIYKHWKDIDGTEYLYEDGQLKIDAYYDEKTKVLVREELLEDGAWQITTHDLIGNISKIEIEHINGNLTTIQYQTDGSIATTITDSRSNILEMTMDYPDGSKTVAQYLDDKTVTTKYGAAGTVLAITTMYNDGRRVEETYDETGKLLSMITRSKGGNREEVVYDADGSVVTSVYTANKLTSVQTVNADGTSVLEEYLEDGSVRVTKYDASGNVLEVTVNGQLVAEENNNLWLIIVIVAVAVIGAAALVIVLVKIRKRNAK